MAAQSKLHVPLVVSESVIKRAAKDIANLYIKNRTRITRTVYITLFIALIERIRHAIQEQKAASARAAEARKRPATAQASGSDATAKKKVEINREFFKNLMRLLRICIPGWRSKELRLLISHSVFLVLRTLISLYVAEMDGKLVSSLVRGKGKEFLKGLMWWMIIAVPATFTNSMVYTFTPCYLRRARLTGYVIALLPPMQALPPIPYPSHHAHPQQISLPHDLLYAFRPRRPHQERRPANHS
jgi:ATP-binding cassette subfamily D (ALD) long-chain fatty acid import protein